MTNRSEREVVLRNQSQTPSRSPTPVQNITKNSTKTEEAHIYFQLFMKIVMFLLALYLLFIVFNGISKDVEKEVERNLEQEKIDAENCRIEYFRNFCDKNDTVPALEAKCRDWEICMNAPVRGIGKSKIAVKYFAQLLNELINPLSPKTLILFIVIVWLFIFIPKI